MKILFICQGNVGRSQMAEAYYNVLSHTKDAASAGIVDVAKKYKGKPAIEIIAIMKEDNIDISSQKVKQLTEPMLQQAQRVVVLCKKDLCPAFLLQNKTIEFREIEDPYQKGAQQARVIRNSVKSLVSQILQDSNDKGITKL